MCVCVRKDLASSENPLKFIFSLSLVLTPIQYEENQRVLALRRILEAILPRTCFNNGK